MKFITILIAKFNYKLNVFYSLFYADYNAPNVGTKTIVNF